MAIEDAPKAADQVPVEDILLGDREHFVDGPPHEIFKRLRGECPVHWTSHLPEWPGEDGFHSVTTWDDVRTVSMDWQTFSSEVGGFRGTDPADDEIWARLMNATLGGGDPDLNPEGPQAIMEKEIPEIFERCQKLIDARRAEPQDDLTTVLVNADVEGSKLEDWEI